MDTVYVAKITKRRFGCAIVYIEKLDSVLVWNVGVDFMRDCGSGSDEDAVRYAVQKVTGKEISKLFHDTESGCYAMRMSGDGRD